MPWGHHLCALCYIKLPENQHVNLPLVSVVTSPTPPHTQIKTVKAKIRETTLLLLFYTAQKSAKLQDSSVSHVRKQPLEILSDSPSASYIIKHHLLMDYQTIVWV